MRKRLIHRKSFYQVALWEMFGYWALCFITSVLSFIEAREFISQSFIKKENLFVHSDT